MLLNTRVVFCCAGKPQMRAICIYVGCIKATTNN